MGGDLSALVRPHLGHLRVAQPLGLSNARKGSVKRGVPALFFGAGSNGRLEEAVVYDTYGEAVIEGRPVGQGPDDGG